MAKPEVWSLEKLRESNLGNVMVWTRPYLREIIEKKLSFPLLFDDTPQAGIDTLIVIGGGILIDKAKVWRKSNSSKTRLIAIPSIWGSGAENSPIAIVNLNNEKVIDKGNGYLPDVRVIWKELADGASPEIIKYACGDVWAHSLEAFLSPIVSVDVKNELSCVIKKIVDLPPENSEAWFECSALACYLQSRSSLGLVHGVSHVLEGILKDIIGILEKKGIRFNGKT
jgi:alcohol dehydrogenase class IV